MISSKIYPQRWKIYPPQPHLVAELVRTFGLSPIMAQVIINRGFHDLGDVRCYISPESENLPSPLQEFPDLEHSLNLLTDAINHQEKIAICGDYDADGMTSTALLIRAFKHLGAIVDYAIPSRMKDGYGLNNRIVEEFKQENVQLILTVDNGISAHQPIALAKELGIKVIITDHHDLPLNLPLADAILNPKLLPKNSPYAGLAGVGVAYILAVTLAQKLAQLSGLTKQLLELYTLGTIADLAPLTGVNRRWLKRGLKFLANSDVLGIQKLIEIGGVNDQKKTLNPEDIGFKLGPRINAIGRIGDPQIVIELLTTNDDEIATARALECNQVNETRQKLCIEITDEAINLIEKNYSHYKQDRVILIVQEGWHHGIIGIVASRLVEKYAVPVFIGTYEGDDNEKIRGSARGIEEYNIFEALQYCDDLLGKYGGHKMAGGFSFETKNLSLIKQRLIDFSHQLLLPEHLQTLVKIDAEINLSQANLILLRESEKLQPWGIENNTPIFCSRGVKVIEQKLTRNGEHLQLILKDNSGTLRCIAWRKSDYFPLPPTIDIAYKITLNEWQGEKNIQLDIQGMKPS
ncbi:MAG: single-stranded-DNA-specific exonuclease RecJ [Cyanobacterium sp. T60_A2020_053]|nr:single-stranded-DNA-specific exonuclease RecJ [Cyanobacterium sp. T60_A2020_053]